jgi:uncharacterized protein
VNTLVVFARAPIEGQVKTRLGRDLGAPAACALYRAFLDDVCAVASSVKARRILAVEGPLGHPELRRLCERYGFALEQQAAGDLGARMQAALSPRLPACAIGSDSPTLGRAQLAEALAALATSEAVVGPPLDGGYWLLGLSQPAPELFDDIRWSSPEVLPLTLERLRGRRVHLLPFHSDVDEAADLRLLAAHLLHLPPEVAPATRRALAALGW